MKGKSVQYHSNISKDEGRIFYENFVTLCKVTSPLDTLLIPIPLKDNLLGIITALWFSEE